MNATRLNTLSKAPLCSSGDDWGVSKSQCEFVSNQLPQIVNILLLATLFGCSSSFATNLQGLIRDALETHPQVRSQKALATAAADEVTAAQWQFYPTPSMAYEKVSTGATDLNYRNGDQNVAILKITQPLWTGGRLTAGLSKAHAGRMASDAGLEITRQDLGLRVVQFYSEWQGGYLKTIALKNSLQSHLRLKVKIDRRIAEGASPAVDRILVEGRVDQTQAELSAAQAQQNNALSNLSQLVGKTVTETELVQELSRPLELGSVQLLLEDAQKINPTIVKFIAAARTQEVLIDERKADLQPEVYLRAERQFGNYSYLNSAPENRIFIGVSSRLGAGLSSLSQVNSARARLNSALEDIESSRISLRQQILTDYLNVESSHMRLGSLKASMQSATQISSAWERQFLAGTKSWLDIMNATRELAQMEVQIADVQATQILLTWRLKILAQGVQSLIDFEKDHPILGVILLEKSDLPLRIFSADVTPILSGEFLGNSELLSKFNESPAN